MTITGLHNFIKPIVVKEHVSSFRGKTAAIDIYHWIHKACYRHYQEMRDPENFHSFLAYIHNRIDLLQHVGLKLVCVFDGRSISKKRKQIQRRNAQKQKDFQMGKELTTLSAEDVQILKKKEQHLAQQREVQLREQKLMIQQPLVREDIDQQDQHFQIIDEQILSQESIKEIGIKKNTKQQAKHQNEAENINQNVIQQQHLSQLIIGQQKRIQQQQQRLKTQEEIIEVIPKIEQRLARQKERIEIYQKAEKIQQRVKTGQKHLKRSVVIGQRHICLVMRSLKERNVSFIVAPYQAELQIAKMHRHDDIQVVISEDSDFIIYEVPAIYKLKLNGECDYLDLKKNKVKVEKGELLSFINMDKIQKAFVAALAGTDYQEKIDGCGMVNAVKNISQYKNLSALRQMAKDPKFTIPDNYQRKALQVALIFLMGSCFNTVKKEIQFLDQKILSYIDLIGMTLDQLYQIVGPDYGFNEQILQGSRQIRSSRVRYLTPLERVAPFQMDTQKIDQLQEMYRKKKEESKKGTKLLIQQSFTNFFKRKLNLQLNLQIKAQLLQRAKLSQIEVDAQNELKQP